MLGVKKSGSSKHNFLGRRGAILPSFLGVKQSLANLNDTMKNISSSQTVPIHSHVSNHEILQYQPMGLRKTRK